MKRRTMYPEEEEEDPAIDAGRKTTAMRQS